MWYQRWWAVSPISWSVYTLSSSHYFQSYHDATIHNDLWLHHGCHVSNDLKQDKQQDGESAHQRHWIHSLVKKVPIYQSTQDVPVPPVAVRTRKSSSVLAYASSFRKRFTNELDSIVASLKRCNNMREKWIFKLNLPREFKFHRVPLSASGETDKYSRNQPCCTSAMLHVTMLSAWGCINSNAAFNRERYLVKEAGYQECCQSLCMAETKEYDIWMQSTKNTI